MILSLAKPATSALSHAPQIRERRPKLRPALTGIYLDSGLLDLVRLRVGQIHGCKDCIRRYTKRLRAKGETTQRLRLLKRWRRETVFSLREKVALNLAEAVTRNPLSSVLSTAVHAASIFFIEEEAILLAMDVVAINDRHYLKSFQHDT